MPFAQWHAPFENEELFEERFPADYICEALDQTRGWFYSLLAISTLLFGRSSYETVLCLGLILDEEGQKMSKSKGNVVVPWDVLDTHGADAFRWYYFTSKQPWDGYRFSLETVGESVRQFLKTLWNTYGFYVLYANVNDVEGEPELTDLDRWVLSRLHATTERVIERLDDYDTTFAGRAIAELVDDLSNWYVRRSRRRFWDGDPAAFETLHTCLVTIAKLLAPLTPFVADAIYENLDGSEPSVHLTDFPEPGERDEQLEWQMAVARDAVELGPRRAGARQAEGAPAAARGGGRGGRPRARGDRALRGARARGAEREVGALRLGGRRARPLRAEAELPHARAALRQADAAGRGRRRGARPGAAAGWRRRSASTSTATSTLIGPDDVQIVLQPLEGYQVERAGTHAVALNLELDDELRREGLAREVVHAVQAARKAAGPERRGPDLADARRRRRAARGRPRARGVRHAETLASRSYDGAADQAATIEGASSRSASSACGHLAKQALHRGARE